MLARTEASHRGVRLLGVGVAGFEPKNREQMDLFDQVAVASRQLSQLVNTVLETAGVDEELCARASAHLGAMQAAFGRCLCDAGCSPKRADELAQRLSRAATPYLQLADLLKDGAAGLGYLLKERVSNVDEVVRAIDEVETTLQRLDPRLAAGVAPFLVAVW